MEHVEDYLRHQLKSHGSSGTAGGNIATGEDLSAVPFAERRGGLVEKYREYLADRVNAAAAVSAQPTPRAG
jgi:hypothetical protein